MSNQKQSLSPAERWQQQNDTYLGQKLAWLRQRLERLASGKHVDVDWTAETAVATALGDAPPALISLSQILGLTRFEQDVLLLCAALELDTRIGRLCARAQDNPAQPFPTLALALALFDRPEWDALSPERPLRYWRLIEIEQTAGQALTASPLHADERIVSYLKGLNYLDSRLSTLLVRLEPPESEVPLPPSQAAVVERILEEVGRPEPAVVQLTGPDLASHHYVARHAAHRLGWDLCRLPMALLPAESGELEKFLRLWQRESALLPLALLNILATGVAIWWLG